MDKKQLIKIGGIVLGTVVTLGYAVYTQIKHEKENMILLDGDDYDVLEAHADDKSR